MPIVTSNRQTVIPSSPPPGWASEEPLYRVTREIHPAERDRYRFERPFSEQGNMDSWQYGARIYRAREEISTREWPHASFFPLNEVARRIHSFLTIAQKSRLPRSPYDQGGRLQLSDGLSGPLPKIKTPKPEPVRLSPGQAWPDF
jgi:hypothetical protein